MESCLYYVEYNKKTGPLLSLSKLRIWLESQYVKQSKKRKKNTALGVCSFFRLEKAIYRKGLWFIYLCVLKHSKDKDLFSLDPKLKKEMQRQYRILENIHPSHVWMFRKGSAFQKSPSWNDRRTSNKVLLYSTGNYINILKWTIMEKNMKIIYSDHFAVHQKLIQHCKLTLKKERPGGQPVYPPASA